MFCRLLNAGLVGHALSPVNSGPPWTRPNSTFSSLNLPLPLSNRVAARASLCTGEHHGDAVPAAPIPGLEHFYQTNRFPAQSSENKLVVRRQTNPSYPNEASDAGKEANLSLLPEFFVGPSMPLVANLSSEDRALVLGEAGFNLRALGRPG